jgi:2-polyprenyl-6-hydroxyphenyl methylase/3-demethylubiquinone-9 3-methyltransferase
MRNVLRGLRQVWGTPRIKQKLWDKEFAEGRWDFIENTANDIVYLFIEKYSRNGSILDLGCGAGNTGCELNDSAYREYTGVDISDVALEKARLRSEACQRGRINRYAQSDISTYIPDREYEVILFRESIYYIPRSHIKNTLERYSRYLKDGGVLIVRLHDAKVADDLLKLIGSSFKILEDHRSYPSGPVVVILRPEATA